jgi:hypothetical protein
MTVHTNQTNIQAFIKEVNLNLDILFFVQDMSKDDRCKIILKLFNLYTSTTIWLGSVKYKGVLEEKCYEILADPSLTEVSDEISKQVTEVIHKTLRMFRCRHLIGDKYCINPKVGVACTYHTNIRTKACCIVKDTTNINKDVLSILFDYVDY